MSAPPRFALSCELRGHEQDVRSVSVTPTGEVVTASRDASVRVWAPAGPGPGYECRRTLLGHSHYVGAVAANAGTVVSGSNDKHVIVWDADAGTPARVLDGHTDVVSCVAVGDAGTLVSGSWDKYVPLLARGRTGGMRAPSPFPVASCVSSAQGGTLTLV